LPITIAIASVIKPLHMRRIFKKIHFEITADWSLGINCLSWSTFLSYFHLTRKIYARLVMRTVKMRYPCSREWNITD